MLKVIMVKRGRRHISKRFREVAAIEKFTVVSLVFMGLGLGLLLVTQAAGHNSSFEAENGTRAGSASVGNDANASNGHYVQFGGSLVDGALYLAPNGSDSNPGTVNQPWKTFTNSLPKLRAGNTLYARGGTYREIAKVTSITAGTASSRITVKNYPGERPVIQGMFWLAYPSYWTVDGINVTWDSANPNQHMVQFYGGTDWVLENSEIWGAHTFAGLLIGDGNRNNLGKFTVRDNCIHDTFPTNSFPQDHNVYIDDISTSPNPQGVVEGNILYNAPNGRGIKLGPPGDIGGPINVIFRYNTVYNSGQYNLSFSKQTHNNQVYRNILVKADGGANIGTFELSGANNVAHDNIGFGATRLLDPGVVDQGGNLKLDPQFDSLSCSGFHPRNSAATGYGKYALP